MEFQHPPMSTGASDQYRPICQDKPQVLNPGILPPGMLPKRVVLPPDLADYVPTGVPGFPVPTIYQLVNKAQSADFFFDIQFFDQYGSDGYVGIDTVYSGQGVADIDHVLEMFGRYRRVIVRMDLGFGTTAASYSVSKADIEFLRACYVWFYGSTAKPNVYPVDQYTLNGSAPIPWNDAG
jgi:hypothetical protein